MSSREPFCGDFQVVRQQTDMFLYDTHRQTEMLNPLFIYLIALQQHKAHYPYNNITLPHTAHGKNYIRGTHVLTHKLNPSTGSCV